MQLFSEFCNICYSKNYDTLTNICIAENKYMKDILLHFIDNPYIINDADTYLCTSCCEQLLRFKEFRKMCLNNLIEMREIYFRMKSKLELETDVDVAQELEIFIKNKVFGQSSSENGFSSNYKNVDGEVRVKEENSDQPPEVLTDNDPLSDDAFGESILGDRKCVSSVDESEPKLHERKHSNNIGDEFGDNFMEYEDLSNCKPESVFVSVGVVIKDELDDEPADDFSNNDAPIHAAFEGSMLEEPKCILPIDERELKLDEVKNSDSSDDEEPFKSEVCTRSFRDQSTRLKHKRVRSGNRPYNCDVCSRSFTKSSVLLHHKRVHSGEKPHECDVCARTFTQKSSLLRHKRTHSGEKPYKCEECSQTFGDYSNMLRHRRVHSGEKPYQCDECAQSFSHRCNLLTHKRVHTGEEPFKCEVCMRSFKYQSTLLKHKCVNSGDRPYQCNV